MASFFVRLQQFGRLYENNAPAYLRTHPLTTERIADMENRAASYPRRQASDSMGFQLVRAKIRSQQGGADDAVTEAQSLLQQRKSAAEGPLRYGLARAYLRANKPALARREVDALRSLRVGSPMVETLAAEVSVAEKDPAAALQTLRQALQHYPKSRALAYTFATTLLDSGQSQEAQRRVADDLRTYPGDHRLWALQARSYAALGKRALEHRSQAEVYALQGQYAAAVQQLEIAQRSGDGDFYVLSAVDSRLRELRARQAEEAKQKR
jgi:beta-barrel assembly-enhancing protease